MFNSSGVFSRNDPVTRRDAQAPVLGSTAQSSTSTDRGAAARTAAENLQASQANQAAKAAAQKSATESAAKPAETVPAAVETDSSVGEQIVGARLIVGPDVKLKGAEILDCDTLVVEGRVEATMDSRVIRIAEKGSFSGKVSIDVAEIYGTFEGELTARSQLVIHSTGRVSGSIRFGKLVVDEGGELCGEINVLSETATVKTRPVVEALSAPRNVASA